MSKDKKHTTNQSNKKEKSTLDKFVDTNTVQQTIELTKNTLTGLGKLVCAAVGDTKVLVKKLINSRKKNN
jgi:DNA transposition AAA+ family ATPase